MEKLEINSNTTQPTKVTLNRPVFKVKKKQPKQCPWEEKQSIGDDIRKNYDNG